jgi:exodeoxyribonuclease VII small subunit
MGGFCSGEHEDNTVMSAAAVNKSDGVNFMAQLHYKRLEFPAMAETQGNTSPPDFETALKRLEEIVRKLESGELPLDSALELFEEGIQLSRYCSSTLERAERRVEVLLRNEAGQLRPTPFESENER